MKNLKTIINVGTDVIFYISLSMLFFMTIFFATSKWIIPTHHTKTTTTFIKLYDVDGKYRGNCPIDSVVINNKTKIIEAYNFGNIAYKWKIDSSIVK